MLLLTNEPFFQGHFPRLPIMPEVLILEAMWDTLDGEEYKAGGDWIAIVAPKV
jgi:3-hydroxymyristoyl/3-hydroxydecanoyl-(acyl carrier protein) dehydratase